MPAISCKRESSPLRQTGERLDKGEVVIKKGHLREFYHIFFAGMNSYIVIFWQKSQKLGDRYNEILDDQKTVLQPVEAMIT